MVLIILHYTCICLTNRYSQVQEFQAEIFYLLFPFYLLLTILIDAASSYEIQVFCVLISAWYIAIVYTTMCIYCVSLHIKLPVLV